MRDNIRNMTVLVSKKSTLNFDLLVGKNYSTGTTSTIKTSAVLVN